jgi:hypothetical protein
MDLREELKKTQAMLDKQLHVMQPAGVTPKQGCYLRRLNFRDGDVCVVPANFLIRLLQESMINEYAEEPVYQGFINDSLTFGWENFGLYPNGELNMM